MRNQIVVEDLNEALAGESGFVDFGGVVGAEKSMGGLADDAVDRFAGQPG